MKYPFPIIENISQVLPLIKDKPEFIVAEKDGGYTVVNYLVQTGDTFPPVYSPVVKIQPVAEEGESDAPIPDGCVVNSILSCICSRGTKCCNVDHEALTEKSEVASVEEKPAESFGDVILNILNHQGDMATLRELRGIIFDTKTGKILHRRLHKFFNVNEREETQINQIDFSQPHVILEKLDGSMITPVMTDAGLRWGTKMGVTQVALPVEEFVINHPQYVDFARECFDTGQTPVFEWCSRQQTIVIDYPEDQLVLIAVRHTKNGDYVTYHKLQQYGKIFKIPVVQAYPGTVSSMQHLVDMTKDLLGVEGFVVRFDDGHMIKVKAEDYLRKHKTKEAMKFEKDVIQMLVNEQADDVKSFMDPVDLARFEKFETDFWHGVKSIAETLNRTRALASELGADNDRKTYAVEFVQKHQPACFVRFMYQMFDYKPEETFGMVKDAIAKSCTTQTKTNEARWMWGDVKWNEVIIEE